MRAVIVLSLGFSCVRLVIILLEEACALDVLEVRELANIDRLIMLKGEVAVFPQDEQFRVNLLAEHQSSSRNDGQPVLITRDLHG